MLIASHYPLLLLLRVMIPSLQLLSLLLLLLSLLPLERSRHIPLIHIYTCDCHCSSNICSSSSSSTRVILPLQCHPLRCFDSQLFRIGSIGKLSYYTTLNYAILYCIILYVLYCTVRTILYCTKQFSITVTVIIDARCIKLLVDKGAKSNYIDEVVTIHSIYIINSTCCTVQFND